MRMTAVDAPCDRADSVVRRMGPSCRTTGILTIRRECADDLPVVPDIGTPCITGILDNERLHDGSGKDLASITGVE